MRPGAVRRVLALAAKDTAELWRHPGAILPALWMAVASVVPPFVIAIVTPRLSGESFRTSGEFVGAARQAIATVPALGSLADTALVQGYLFHQFSPILLLLSVVGSMALAAHAIISEKTARTLEPLLATPLSTTELLAGKTFTPLVFSLAITWTTLAVYVFGIAVLAEPGVWATFASGRTLLMFFVIAPLLTVVSLLLAVIISSRVNDPRSAQQLGTVVVLPVTAVFVAQLMGQFILGTRALLLSAVGLALLAALLLAAGVWVFDRERILMRWK